MKIIFSTLVLFAAHTAFGQKIHEIKTDLLLPTLAKGAHLAYEVVLEKKWGLELEARYRWGVEGYINCPTCDVLPSRQRVFTFNLNAKVYFLDNPPGVGPYAGAYLREDWRVSPPDPVFGYLIIPEYHLPIWEAQPDEPHLRRSIGLLAGYKFLLWKRWTLDACMGLDWDYRWLFGDRRGMDWTGIPSLKAGYRL